MSWGRTPRPARRLGLLLGSCLLSLGVVGCASASAPPPQASPADEVITLTNARRAQAGCGPVASQPQLENAAQLHADDMATNRYFSHTSLDGRGLGERARGQGYGGSALGENIAQGQTGAQSVVDAWMGSSGHRANIENCAYTDIGVGYNASTQTWVQVFGA